MQRARSSAASAVVGGIGEFLLQMVVGIAVGAIGGVGLGWAQRHVRLPNEALYPLRTIAFAALIYGAATLLHGSGYLAVFLAGIIIGVNLLVDVLSGFVNPRIRHTR